MRTITKKQLSDTNRAKSDLLSAFRGTPFESGLKPSVPTIDADMGARHIKPDTTEHTASGIDSPQQQDIAKNTAKPMPPSGLQNKEYDNKGLWYIPGTENSNPPSPASKPSLPITPTSPSKPSSANSSETTNIIGSKVKPIEPKPKAVRSNVENAGGSVKWNPENNKATIKINGYTEDFYVGDEHGTFIQDGVMYTDSLHLDNLVHAPKQTQVKTIYDGITDDFGKFVVRKWLYGDGSEVHVSGERWNSFINNNPEIQKIFKENVQQCIREEKTNFDVITKVALTEDGKGGFTSGYELINGSNKDVGGFALQGNISPRGNGIYFVTIQYTFNDIIDPNKAYFTDRYYSTAADFLGVSGKDYTLKISGTANFTYYTRE